MKGTLVLSKEDFDRIVSNHILKNRPVHVISVYAANYYKPIEGNDNSSLEVEFEDAPKEPPHLEEEDFPTFPAGG